MIFLPLLLNLVRLKTDELSGQGVFSALFEAEVQNTTFDPTALDRSLPRRFTSQKKPLPLLILDQFNVETLRQPSGLSNTDL